MKKMTLLFLLTIAFAKIYAQNYQINFSGTGTGTTVDSVKVENLSQCTVVSIAGNDVLNLSSTMTGINPGNSTPINSVVIYPNPSAGSFSVEFDARGQTVIELSDLCGQLILKKNEVLQNGHQILYLNGVSN